jgi:hypothetical protein
VPFCIEYFVDALGKSRDCAPNILWHSKIFYRSGSLFYMRAMMDDMLMQVCGSACCAM